MLERGEILALLVVNNSLLSRFNTKKVIVSPIRFVRNCA